MFPPIPDKQKALWLTKAQGKFEVGEADIPQPGPGEVLIREEAVGLNPVDYLIQQTGFLVKEYPVVLGWDGAGVVVGLGEGVHDFSLGDRVLHPGLLGNAYAAYKQYTISPIDVIAKIPSNISYDRAAAIPLTLNTAALGLYAKPSGERGGAGLIPPWEPEGHRKYAGQPIFVLGGSSSVGQFAIQLARLSGFSPIVTTASLKHADYLKELGATHVLDRNLDASSIKAAIREITTVPFEIGYDAVSYEDTQNLGYELIAPGGTLVVVTHVQIAEDKRSIDKKIADIFAHPTLPDRRPIAATMYKHVTALFASGELKPNHTELVPGGLAGIPGALERFGKEGVSGLKLVAHPQETW